MQKTRIISAIVASILLLLIMWSNEIVLGIAVFLLSLIGIHEFYNAVEAGGYKPIKVVGYVACVPILALCFNVRLDLQVLAFAVFIFMVILLAAIIFLHHKYNIIDISFTAFGILYVPFLFSFILLIRYLPDGFFLIWMVFIGAWVTDIAAYFTGRYLGRNKLLPAISPKKTLEGAIGGVIGTTIITLVYGIILHRNNQINYIPVYHFFTIGAFNGIISQVGDWAASAIKRYVKIKDYGKLMPGHGGVLDRCDSILFTAPVIYFYIVFLLRL